MSQSEIRDAELASSGKKKIAWARQFMWILNKINERFSREKPFKGFKIGMCIHLEAKTAYLAQVFQSGGAKVAISGSNPLSTQDDVAAALATSGVEVHSWYGATAAEYKNHLKAVLNTEPDIIIDDGADLVSLLHGPLKRRARKVLGGCEETTTGVTRLKALEREGKLLFPMFAVNDAMMKYLFDNRYGTGQSTWDGLMRTTNLTVAGKTVVVVGYGWCGKGIAMRAKGLGANVIVTEVDPIKAVEAVMDGFHVMRITEAAKVGDIFVTATGCIDAIDKKSLRLMKDGAILANAGHFDVEISKPDLQALAIERKEVRKNIEEFRLKDGRRLYLLAEGRLVNLAAADGHPIEIMDLSFALQALTAEYILKNHRALKPGLYPVPAEIDQQVARMKLETMGIKIDSLSQKQQEYLEKWR